MNSIIKIDEKKSCDVMEKAQNIIVACAHEADEAVNLIKRLSELESEIKSSFDRQKKLTYQAHKEICDEEKKHLAPIKSAKSLIVRKIGGYIDAEKAQNRTETAVKSISQRNEIEIIVENFADVEDQFKMLNEKAVKSFVSMVSPDFEIKGLKIVKKTKYIYNGK